METEPNESPSLPKNASSGAGANAAGSQLVSAEQQRTSPAQRGSTSLSEFQRPGSTLDKAKWKKWSIMVYMAGGDNASDAARDSLLRMKQIGSTEHFHLVAQFDSGSGRNAKTKRYYLRHFGKAERFRTFFGALDKNEALREASRKCMESVLQRRIQILRGQRTESSDPVDGLYKRLIDDDQGASMEGLVKYMAVSESMGDVKRVIGEREEGKRSVDNLSLLKSSILDRVLDEDKDGEDLPSTDTGDPKVFKDFLLHGIQQYPAEHTMVVIWGHGNGLSVAWDGPSAQSVRDLLTTVELKEVFSLTGPRINIVGFNACMMGMIEVYHQLRGSVDIGIGSEGLTPRTSWPYEKILKALCQNPEMGPYGLAETIVSEYGKEYRAREHQDKGIDLSACNIVASQNVVNSLKRLVKLLLERLSDGQGHEVINAIKVAQREAQSFGDYVDIYDFCQRLRESCQQTKIQRACDEVMIAVQATVLKCVRKGESVRNSYGLSFYFPSNSVSSKYDGLDFTRQSGWKKFLESNLGSGKPVDLGSGKPVDLGAGKPVDLG